MVVDNNKKVESYLQGLEHQGQINRETLEGYKKELELFKEFVYPESLVTQTNYGILRYIEKLKERYSPLTIKKKVTILNGFYKYLLKKEIIEVNPVEGVTLPTNQKARERQVDKGEIRSVLDYCDNDPKGTRDKLLITLISLSGEKINDLLSIKLDDIILFKEINILKKKGIIKVELDEESSQLLRDYIENKRDKIEEPREEYLFKNLSRQNFRARFIKYCKMAGINEEISPVEIKKIVKKERDSLVEEGLEREKKIKEAYIKIGIGDD